MATIFLEEAL